MSTETLQEKTPEQLQLEKAAEDFYKVDILQEQITIGKKIFKWHPDGHASPIRDQIMTLAQNYDMIRTDAKKSELEKIQAYDEFCKSILNIGIVESPYNTKDVWGAAIKDKEVGIVTCQYMADDLQNIFLTIGGKSGYLASLSRRLLTQSVLTKLRGSSGSLI